MTFMGYDDTIFYYWSVKAARGQIIGGVRRFCDTELGLTYVTDRAKDTAAL